jgi:tryptophan synthase alpha chain
VTGIRFGSRRPLLVPYVTAGVTADWTDHVRSYVDAGADAVEIGLPFSDPMLDGRAIQEASDRALRRGTTVPQILADVATLAPGVPLIGFTYANLGQGATLPQALRDAGFSGLIVPDLPFDESADLATRTAAAGIDLVLLAAPATPTDRLTAIAGRSKGFVYAISVMGTTGERSTLGPAAADLAGRLRALTDLPVVLGFGISSAAQAAEAARYADGVALGAALLRRILDGERPAAVGAFLSTLRRSLDLTVTA